MRVYLTGFMGAGKTTVGRLLAQRLECSFVDLDEAVEQRARLPVAGIFERLGEAGFRQLEGEELRGTRRQPRVVVATGGGTPVDEANRRWMRTHGVVVWLEIAYERIAERLGEGAGRPLWHQGVETRRLFDQRLPGYRDCDLSIAVGSRSPAEVVAAIAAALAEAGLR